MKIKKVLILDPACIRVFEESIFKVCFGEFIEKGFNVFILITPYVNKSIVRNVLDVMNRYNIMVILKEATGSSGGDLISSNIFISSRERVLVISDIGILSKDLVDIIDIFYSEFTSNSMIVSKCSSLRYGSSYLKEPIYVRFKRGRIVGGLNKKYDHSLEYVFTGIMMLKKSFFHRLQFIAFKRPELYNSDIIDVLNAYIETGGRIYAYKLEV